MWNKRKEEEYPARPAAPVAPPAAAPASAIQKESIPMSASPMRHPEADLRGAAVIGKSVMIKGQIISREDLTIDGEVEGTVELQEHRLTVGPHGKVRADIKAREIIVLGNVYGNVEVADKIEIRKDAKLVGDIKTARIVIEDGAYFKGTTDIIRPEPKPAPAAPRPAAVQPAPIAVAAAAPSSAPAAEVKR
jgi:cytoskeletal protein CcmA (bactofilin family)